MSRFLSAKEALISGFDIQRNRFEKHQIARMCRSQNSLAERHLAAVGCHYVCGPRLVDSLPRNRLARAVKNLKRNVVTVIRLADSDRASRQLIATG